MSEKWFNAAQATTLLGLSRSQFYTLAATAWPQPVLALHKKRLAYSPPTPPSRFLYFDVHPSGAARFFKCRMATEIHPADETGKTLARNF